MSRSQLSWNAATLGERLAYLRSQPPAPPASVSDGGGDASLAPWARACALGDREAFLRRLTWDDVAPATASAALAGQVPDGFPVADWVGPLASLMGPVVASADVVGSPDWEAEVHRLDPSLPFVDLWLPLAQAATRRLVVTAPACASTFSTDALTALERHLLSGICHLSALSVLEAYAAQSPRRDAGSSDGYLSFVRTLLSTGYSPLWSTYPVLARHVGLLVDQWRAEIVELADRLSQDRAALAAVFGAEATQVRRLTPGLSDRHAGGRHVVRVEFTSGLQLAYKPRDLRLETAYNEWLSWLERAGMPSAPRALRTLARASHGWSEWAEQGASWSADDVRAYLRQAGALVCLTYVLGGTDLHSENLVATASGPVLVDTEMLLQPSTRPGPSADGADEWVAPVTESCLASGLISAVVIDRTGTGFDVGGLRPAVARELAVPMRRWVNLRTDAIAFEPEHRVHPALRNDVIVDGAVQRPEDFADELCAGFVEAYRFLESRRAALLAPDGPLAGFANCPVRVLFRPSDQYAAAQYLMAAPRYQRSGVERSLAIETFHRVFIADTERPRIWPMVREEREALEALDIPRVTLPAAATDLRAADGQVVEGYYVRSGMDAIRSRLGSLSHDDCLRQVDLLRAALSDAGVRRSSGRSERSGDPLCTAAEQIGAALLARAQATADGALLWSSSGGRTDLYGGASGVGLFFAALAAMSEEPTWRTAAGRVLRPLAEGRPTVADAPLRLGACTGAPSTAYALAVSGHLLDEPVLVDAAVRLACAVSGETIDADTVLDVEGGCAGALLALLAVHDLQADEQVLDLARRCVVRLVSTQVRTGPFAGAWLAGDDPTARPGFAHGAAGIAAALSRWARRTGDSGVFETIEGAWAFERRVFAEHAGAYPTVRSDGGRVVMAAWCHGAPGVALGRAMAPVALEDERLHRELDTAMGLTMNAPAGQLDHLCCGNLGRADVALTVGQARQRPVWRDSGVAACRAVASRVLAQGRLGMRGRGFQRGAAAPELFQGLAGIGYQLLRAGAPHRLPSLLAFEIPVRGTAGSDSRDHS